MRCIAWSHHELPRGALLPAWDALPIGLWRAVAGHVRVGRASLGKGAGVARPLEEFAAVAGLIHACWTRILGAAGAESVGIPVAGSGFPCLAWDASRVAWDAQIVGEPVSKLSVCARSSACNVHASSLMEDIVARDSIDATTSNVVPENWNFKVKIQINKKIKFKEISKKECRLSHLDNWNLNTS